MEDGHAGAVNRTGWGPGPWDGEPDQRVWLHAGMLCAAIRKPVGFWCRYVALPQGHPDFGNDYNNSAGVDVHGGLTYAQHPPYDLFGGMILSNHLAYYWVFGFDCAHSGDLSPGIARFALIVPRYEAVYRTLAYVTREVNAMANQLNLAWPARAAARKVPLFEEPKTGRKITL
mgnify:CR=1 FL=1